MKKIEKLTEAQIAKFPEYRDRWLKIGLSTERADRNKCNALIKDVYKVAGLDEPKIKIWLDSPLQGIIAARSLEGNKQAGDQVYHQVSDQVRDQVWGQVRDQVWGQVRDQVWGQVWGQVSDQVRDQVYHQVRDQVYHQVRDQVDKLCFGSHDANWLAFYQFFGKECGLDFCSKLNPLMAISEHCGWFWPFQGAVIFTERPVEIHRNEIFQLHNFNGPALKYADGFSLFRFNGVRMNQAHATTPASYYTKEIILTETNADVRREIIRKIGIERAVELLEPKVIDKMGDYQLILLDLGDKRQRPYLKMKNPSIDAWHVEGVEPGIKTVKAAIAWRNGLEKYQGPEALS